MRLRLKDDQSSNQNCVLCVSYLKFIWNQISLIRQSGVVIVAATQKEKLGQNKFGYDEGSQWQQVLNCNKYLGREETQGKCMKHLCCLSLVCPVSNCQLMGGDCIATAAVPVASRCCCWCAMLAPAPELNIVSTATALCASTAPTLSHSNLS